jgi:Mg2+ and Co2+ transporter CorA
MEFFVINNLGKHDKVTMTKSNILIKFPSIRERDLHIIDKNLQFRNSAISIKNNIIIIKLYFIRCIITPKEVYLIDHIYENIPYNKITDIETKIAKNIIENIDISFEFKVLESILICIRDYFDDIIVHFLSPKMSIYYDAVNSDNTSMYVKKKEYSELYKLIITLQSIVQDITDMLTDVAEWEYHRFDDFNVSRTVHDKQNDNRNEHIIDLINTYKTHFEENSDDITTMIQKMDMIIKITNIDLAATRNKIARFDINVNILMVAITIINLVSSSYGMNVPNYLETNPNAFVIICCIMGFISIVTYFMMRCIFIKHLS